MDPRDVDELRRLQRKVDTIAGPLVTNTKERIYIGDKSEPISHPPVPFRVLRMSVTNGDAAPDVVLAKIYDGATASGTDIPVRVYWQREVDDVLYAFLAGGGTDAIYLGAPVIWLEMYSLGRGQYDGMGVFTIGGQPVWSFTPANAVPGLSL